MKNKLYIVTGGSNGLGKAIVLNLLEKNHFVISLSKSLISQIYIKDYNDIFFQLKIDFSRPFKNQTVAFLNKIISQIKLKNIDQIILINNAAVISPIDRIENLNEIDISKHIQINLSAPIIMTRVFLELFFKFKGFKIVTQITSGAATSPVDGWSLYCAGKSGLNMFNQVLALQNINDKKFKTIGYSPGIMNTNMQKNIRSARKNQFPEIQEFKKFKTENKLRSAECVAQDLLQLLDQFKNLESGQIYRVKSN